VTPLERVAAVAEQLRRADQEADRLRAELRAAFLEAHREGKSLREIARAAGISSTRVHQIVHESLERVPGGVHAAPLERALGTGLWGAGSPRSAKPPRDPAQSDLSPRMAI
jgi:hypothetical protein